MSASRHVAGCLAALAAVIGGPCASATAAPAAVPPAASPATTTALPHATAADLTATLVEVSPQVASPTTDVTIRVAVRNTSASAVSHLAVRAELRSVRFTRRGAVGEWLASDTGPGALLSSTDAAPASATLGPGASTVVSVTIPRDRWRLGRPFAVMPVQLLVTGTRDGGIPVEATARTVVPWTDASQSYVPLGLAWVVPLTVPADAALFAEDPARSLTAWQRAIGPGSAVRTRLEATGANPVTWLVDPALLDARKPANAHLPAATATSALPASDPVTELQDSLADALRKRPSTQNVWALPPSDPDTAVLTATDLDDQAAARLYVRGDTALDRALGTTVPRDVVWPADGAWTTSRTNAFRSLADGYPLSAALVSTSSIASPKGYTAGATGRTGDGTGLLSYDDELSDIAGGTAKHAKGLPDAQVVQSFLAESLVLLGEREGTARNAIVALPREATTDAAVLHDLLHAAGSAPWLRTTTLPALTAGTAAAPKATTVPSAVPAATPLTPAEVRRDETRGAALRGIGGILPPAAGGQDSLAQIGDELFSARWRQSPAAYRSLAAQVDSRIEATRRGVQVSPANVNFLTDAGAVAITVTNDLPYPVSNVHLRLVPGNGRLRVTRQPGPVSIKARSRATVRVEVTALGSGEVPVVAHVVTPSGVELGTPRTVTMNVRPPAEWILWVIGAGLLLVLVAGLARALTRQPTRAVRDDLVVPPHDGGADHAHDTVVDDDSEPDDAPAPDQHRGDR